MQVCIFPNECLLCERLYVCFVPPRLHLCIQKREEKINTYVQAGMVVPGASGGPLRQHPLLSSCRIHLCFSPTY